MNTCTYTSFDRMIYLTEPLPKSKIKEGSEILQNDRLCDLLNFCVESGCFTKENAAIADAFITMYESPDSTYWENHKENYVRLLDAIGLSKYIFNICIAYFDAVLETKPLPKSKIEEGRKIFESGLDRIAGLSELLSFCTENDCIGEEQEHDIYSFAEEFEDFDNGCAELSQTSYGDFLEAIGVLAS